MSSTHSNFHCTVERIARLEKHPNADTLELVYLAGPGGVGELGYTCTVKQGEFKAGQLVTYVSVDSMVPVDNPLFSFLLPRANANRMARVKAVRLRGVFSMGLVVPLPKGAYSVGHDLVPVLGITKYLTKEEQWELAEETKQKGFAKLRSAKGLEVSKLAHKAHGVAAMAILASWVLLPWQWALVACLCVVAGDRFAVAFAKRRMRKPNIPMYDIAALRRCPAMFTEGEEVVITEKLHGTNARFVYTNGKLHVGSRTVWREPDASVWWQVARKLNLQQLLRKYPNVVLYGEIVGPGVQDLGYGVPQGQVRFYAFDCMELYTRRYWDFSTFKAFCDRHQVPVVPGLYKGPYDAVCLALAEGKTHAFGLSAGIKEYASPHVREGIVIRPLQEQVTPYGRKLLKHVGTCYYERKVDPEYTALEADTRGKTQGKNKSNKTQETQSATVQGAKASTRGAVES